MLNYDLIHDNISKIAHHKKITLSELERKAGLDRGDLCRCENGAVKKITLEEIYATAEALGVTIDALLHKLPKINADACPFCGGEPAMSGGGLGVYFVTCCTCHAQGPEGISAASAEALWNERVYGGGELYNWGLIFKEVKNGE